MYGAVIPVGDLHISSYIHLLNERLEAYKDAQVYCLRECIPENDTMSIDDVLDSATLVVGFEPNNDVEIFCSQVEVLKIILAKEEMHQELQFVTGIECWQAFMLEEDSEEEEDDDYRSDDDSCAF